MIVVAVLCLVITVAMACGWALLEIHLLSEQQDDDELVCSCVPPLDLTSYGECRRCHRPHLSQMAVEL